MMKTVLSSLFVATIVFSSCGPKNIKDPEYRDVRNIRLVELGPLQSTAGADLVFYNPNNFGVSVTDGSGDIYVDSLFLGHFDLSDKVVVKKDAEFTLPIKLKIDMIGLIRNQKEILKRKDALLRLEGNATLKKATISRTLPFKYETVQDVEKLKALFFH